MIPKVKATKTSQRQSVLQDFSEEFMKSHNNELYCNLCRSTISCNKRFLVESHQNTCKHQKALGCRSELLIPHTLQTFLRSSNTDFAENVTKAFLSADIPCTSETICISKTNFTTMVTICHLKLPV